jgi:hypothetical protein
MSGCEKKSRSIGKKEKRRIRKAKKAEAIRLHSRAWLITSAEGWLASIRKYESETIRKERSGT